MSRWVLVRVARALLVTARTLVLHLRALKTSFLPRISLYLHTIVPCCPHAPTRPVAAAAAAAADKPAKPVRAPRPPPVKCAAPDTVAYEKLNASLTTEIEAHKKKIAAIAPQVWQP
jgi:hypothetical protein